MNYELEMMDTQTENSELALTAFGLRLFAAYTRRTGLPQIWAELVRIFQSLGHRNSDILEALGDYAIRESGNATAQQQPTWETVASLLKAAALACRVGEKNLPPDHPQEVTFAAFTLRLLTAHARRPGLIDELAELILIFQNQNYRFSDILSASADYALSESRFSPEQRLTWETIGFLLKDASEASETRGRELP